MANSHRPCRFCKKYSRVEDMLIINRAAYCNDSHAYEYSLKKRMKDKAKVERFVKKQRRADYLPDQIENTRILFNSFIRILDAGKPCKSCGKEKCGSVFHAGHFKSVGSHPELRFDPRNVYAQGRGCNLATENRRRNTQTVSKEYEQRLRDEYGNHYVDWICGPHEPKQYTCAELKELRLLVSAETRRLKEGLPPSRDWRALCWKY